MSLRKDHPQYALAVQAYLSGDSKAFHALRTRAELSTLEKQLLQARGLSREKKWKQEYELLLALIPGDESFLAAERYFLLASAQFFLGNFEAAAGFNLQALQAYQFCQDRRGIFLSAYNASVDFSRMGLFLLSKQYLNTALLRAETPDEKTLILEAIACQQSNEGNFNEACKTLDTALLTAKTLPYNDQAALLAVAADIYFRAGRYSEAKSLLHALAQNPAPLRERARIHFELAVLKAILEKTQLPPTPLTVQSSPEYTLKWSILYAIQSGDREKAHKLWTSLRKQSPQKFGSPFKCLVDSESKAIFFTFLQSLLISSTALSQTLPFSELKGSLTGLPQKLIIALKGAKMPLRKEELIEEIWQTPYDPALDSRFYKLVERLKKHHIPIVCKKRAYSLRVNLTTH